MKVIITTCPGREHLLERLLPQIPKGFEVIVNKDDFKDPGKFKSTAYWNYLRSWQLAGKDDCIQMDDDIVLSDSFSWKFLEAITVYPGRLIQFFSMRKKDLTVGTRIEPGRTFMMQQCYYLPPGFAHALWLHSERFTKETTDLGAPTDLLIADFLKKNGFDYVIWVPNLVNHLQVVSEIDKRRSSKRQSLTFQP